jgi:transglutaminase-like putative cysteine protease
MMLSLTYQMQIDFSQPVSHHQYLFRLLPRLDRYQAQQMRLMIDQQVIDLNQVQTDGFGNALIAGQSLNAHSGLTVQLTALLRSQPYADLPSPQLFLPHTPLTYLSQAEASAWLIDLDTRQVQDTKDLALTLMRCVFSRLSYQRGQTQIHHPVRALLMQPIGVCQDYAHLLIALLRHHRLPARYMVGVAQGEGESHAWVEVWLGDAWLALDPTHNNEITADMPYLSFAMGRDSSDCTLNAGTFRGNAQQTLSVQAQLALCH